MRQIVLDTETTGLEVEKGHRIIELGCVELLNRRRTHRTLHYYLQPDREIDPGAQEVHGISSEMLAGKPRFAEIVQEFLDFISDAELIIHNADFDLAFINAELHTAGRTTHLIPGICAVLDTLAMARRLHPGQRNSLDALCRRYGVDNAGREFHGALLDAQLLADVYLGMTGGQAALLLDQVGTESENQVLAARPVARENLNLKVIRASGSEIAAHEEMLALLDSQSSGKTLWRRSGSH